jgi:hypothetical protein
MEAIMAGNGDAQRLGQLEETLSQAAMVNYESGDMVARLDAAVNACRALGQEARAIEEMSTVFAAHLEKVLAEFHKDIRDRVAELDKVLGRLGKRTPPVS